MTDQDQKNIENFFSTVATLQAGYGEVSLYYLAIKQANAFVLVHARVLLQTGAPSVPQEQFQTAHVRAGRYRLLELGLEARSLLGNLMTGTLSTPHGDLVFPLNDRGISATIYQPFHNEAFQSQARFDVLTLIGTSRTALLKQPHLDWELRGAATPFDGFSDLLNTYNLGVLSGDAATIEFVAFNVAAIDATSTVKGDKASVGLLLAPRLARENARLGYRVLGQGRVLARSVCETANMQWGERDQLQCGTANLDVPHGAVLHCYASYSGITQHHYWVGDPSNAQNPRRAMYQAFDPQLEILHGFFSAPHNRFGADDLEAGVQWLAWMLGFSVAHLGGTQKTRNAPDLIAVAPLGHVIVIECTTGLLRADNKLPLLVARAETIRTRLRASGNAVLRVLPVIATSMTREEIKADLDQAEKLGVGVLAREELLALLNRTIALTDAQTIYDEAEKNLLTAQSKYESKSAI